MFFFLIMLAISLLIAACAPDGESFKRFAISFSIGFAIFVWGLKS